MAVETLVDVVCADCGGPNVDCRGVIVACRPCERPQGRGPRRYQRVLERRYVCGDCEGEFTTAEQLSD